MNKKNIIIFISISFIALILFNYSQGLKSEIREASINLNSVEKDGVFLNDLKNRWENRGKNKKIIKYLKQFSQDTKVKTRGNKITFKFGEMNRVNFNKLSKKILQSTVRIKKFIVERVDNYNVTLFLEVEK